MGAIVEGVLCNIFVDILYSVVKKVSGITGKKEEETFKNKIHIILSEKLAQYYNTTLDSGTFYNYVRLPQVSDIIQNYIIFIISGIYMNNMKSNDKIKNYNEEEIIEYLSRNALKQFSNQLTIPSLDDIKFFFRTFFSESKLIFYTNLNFENKILVYLINLKISRLEEVIRKSYAFEIQEIKKDYEIIANRYYKVLKSNNELAFIYGLSEFKLEQFYVFPDLIIDNNNNINVKMVKNIELSNLINLKNITDNNIEIILDNRIDKIISKLYIWQNLFYTNNIVYVVGGAGFGKSLLLKNIINNYKKLDIYESDKHIVIYSDLKSYYNSTKASYSIIEFLRDSMINSTGIEISKDFIEYYLNLGRCIILFDALDEVPKDKRDKLHTILIGFFTNCNPNNKVCITSRDRVFLPKKEIEVYNICPLTKEQIIKYLDNMIKLRYFSEADKELFLRQADVLMEKKFLNNFLTLSLLISIFRAEKELPETKLELYDKCFEYIAKKREIEKNKMNEKYDMDLIKSFMSDSTFIQLSLLACPNNKSIDENDIVNNLTALYKTRFVDINKTEIAIYSFLDFCSERTELLVNAELEKKYKFYHRSFFEYFYSKYIYRFNDPEKVYDLFMQFDIDSEIFELTIAIIKKDDESRYQRFVDYLFELINVELKTNKFTAFNILTLIMQIVDDECYKKQYYNLFIINYRKVINNSNVVKNYEIINVLLKKIIQEDSEKVDILFDKYKLYSIVSLVPILSHALSPNLVYKLNNIDSEIKRFYEYTPKTAIFESRLLITPIIKNMEKFRLYTHEFLSLGFQNADKEVKQLFANYDRKGLKKLFIMKKNISVDEIVSKLEKIFL